MVGSLTRVRNNQVYNSDIYASAKLVAKSVTGGLLSDNFTYTGNMTIGNLTVNGNTTTLDTTNLVIADPLFAINRNQSGSPTYDLGTIMGRGNQTNVAFIWEETAKQFQLQYTIESTASTTYGTINNSGFANLQAYGVLLNNATVGIANITTANITNAVFPNIAVLGGTINNTTIGSTTPNTGIFTTLTSTGQVIGYFNGAIGANAANTGAFSTASTTGNLTVGGNINITGNIIPSANVTYNLGSPTLRWKTLYLAGNTVYIGGIGISDGGGYLQILDVNGLQLGIQTASINNTIIGNTGPAAGTFTTLSVTNGGSITGYFNGALGANTPNSVVATSVTTSGGGQISGYLTGALGANTPNSVVATSVTTSGGGQISGYLTGAIGANSANSGVFTTLTTSGTITSSSQVVGYFSGAIGANSANSGAFTTVTTSGSVTASGNITAQTANIYAANIIGNTSLYGAQYYWTNGATLASTITGTYSNSNVTAYLPTYSGTLSPSSLTTNNGGQISGYLTGAIGANAANSAVFTTVSATNNITATTANIYAANVIGNTAAYGAQYYWTNGATLASTITGTYSNSNVGGYLTSYSGALTASSVTTTGGGQLTGYLTGAIGANSANSAVFTTVSASGNITAQTANVYAANFVANTASYSPAYYYPNGVNILSAVIASAYSNANAAAYLTIYSGNLSAGNITVTNGGVITGYLNGVIGANGANSSTFSTTSITSATNTSGLGTGALVVTQGGAAIQQDLYVGGNIYAANIISQTSQQLVVSDPLLYLSANAGSYNYEIGFYSHFVGGNVPQYAHTGLVRNHTDQNWYLFSNLPEPSGGTINLSNASIVYDTIRLGAALIQNTTTASSTTSGALQVSGGAGIAGALYAGSIQNTPIGSVTPSSGVFTGVTSTGQVTGYLTGAIGANTANSGAFTTLTASTVSTSGNITAQTANVYAANLIGNTALYGAQFYWTNGATLASTITGSFSNSNVNSYLPTYTGTLSPSSLTTNNGGQVIAYLTGAIGANVANTGAFTTLTSSGALTSQGTITGAGQVIGYFNGAIGANTANSGAFTTLTSSGIATISGNLVAASGTGSADTTSGALVVTGGVGVSGTLNSRGIRQYSTTANSYIGYNGGFSTEGAVGSNFMYIQALSNNNASGVGIFSLNTTYNQMYSSGAIAFVTGATIRSQNTTTGGVQYVWIDAGGNLIANSTTASTSTTTGALVVTGGLGVSGNIAAAIGNFTNLNTTSNITAQTANVYAAYTVANTGAVATNFFYSNGTSIANTIAASAYSNTNAGAYLTVYNGNIKAAYITAVQVGNTGTLLTGTLTTNAQPYITSVGTLGSLTVSTTISGSVSGNAGSATQLQNSRNINGVPFNGTSDITITVDANNLTGTTLASGVTASSLQSVGFLNSLSVNGNINTCNSVITNSVTAGVYTQNISTYDGTGNLNVYIPQNANLTVNAGQVAANLVVHGNSAANYQNLLVTSGATGQVGIKVAPNAITSGASLQVNATDSIIIPAGTTGNRPTGAAGMIRYNTTTNQVEFYNTGSGQWTGTGSTFTTVTSNQFTGDGANVAFTLSQSATTNSTIVAINGVVQIPTTAYSVSGTTLTFTEAPLSTDIIDARVVVTTSTATSLSQANTSVTTTDTGGTTGTVTVTANNTTRYVANVGTGGSNYFNGGQAPLMSNVALTQNTPTAIDSFSASAFRGAKYVIKVTDGTSNRYSMAEVIVVHDGTTPTSQIYGVVNTGANALASFSTSISGGNVYLNANTWSSTASATMFPTYMPV